MTDHKRGYDETVEQARAIGGDELADQIKAVAELQADFVEAIGAQYMHYMKRCEAAGIKEALACSGAASAFSHSYAISIALFGKINNLKPDQVLDYANLSLRKNYALQTVNVEAHFSGVEDLIMAAGKREKTDGGA